MKWTTLATTAILLTAGAALLPAADAATTTRLVVFGDTSANSATQKNVDGALAEGAQGFVGLGDYNYDHSASAWKTMFKPLTDKGAWMALGNHDDRNALGAFFPDGSRWSKSVAGARIVALNGMETVDTARLRSDLCNAPESIRIVITHHNWWLGSAAHHPGSEFKASASTMDAILRDCGVDLVLAGHEHNYQRMTRNGIPYVIAGTGGRGLYPVEGSPSGTVATCECLGRLVLDLSSEGFTAQFKALDGSVKDSFSQGTAAPAPSPGPSPSPSPTSVAFTPKGGNGWWAQVAVTGSPTAVAARDTGGAWVSLAKKSWGDWAASFRIEPGHDVQYRATLSGGTIVESCWYDHPSATCAPLAPPAPASPSTPTPAPSGGFTARFENVRGNAWWVETDVATSGGTLASVDARVNGGTWVPLAAKSWGSWAKSVAAPNHSRVEFRATSTGGATAVSSAYAWPPG